MSDTTTILFFYITIICRIANMSEDEKASHYVIEAVFYDDEYGYGSKLNTLKTCKTNKSKYNYV